MTRIARSCRPRACELRAPGFGTRPRTSTTRSVSQLARSARAMLSKSLFSELVQLAGAGIALDRSIELCRIESFEPRAKARQLVRSKLFNSPFDVFGSGHLKNISSSGAARKDAAQLFGVSQALSAVAPRRRRKSEANPPQGWMDWRTTFCKFALPLTTVP